MNSMQWQYENGMEAKEERDHTIEFNPTTMTRATPEDIARIWKQLFGDMPMPENGHFANGLFTLPVESDGNAIEPLDLTQI